MKTVKFTSRCIRLTALGLACVLVSMSSIYGQAKVGSNDNALPLSLSNSARSLALGGAASTLVDEYAGLHNPGALALFYLDNYASVTAPLSVDTWRDLSFKSFAIGAGWIFNPAGAAGKHSPRVAFAASYTQSVLDIRVLRTTYSNPFGEIPPTFFTASNLVSYYSLSLGVEYFARAGIGATLRRDLTTFEELESSPNNHVDFGAHFSIAFDDIFWAAGASAGFRDRVFMNLAVAFVSLDKNLTSNALSIVNGVIVYVKPKNRTNRFGASLSWGVGNAYVNHLSIRALYDHLTNPELVFLGSLPTFQKEQDMYGIELGFEDALFVRTGRSIEKGANQWGVGVNLRQLVKTVIPGSPSRSPANSSFMRAVDLKIDIAQINRNSSLLEDFTYINVSLIFRRP